MFVQTLCSEFWFSGDLVLLRSQWLSPNGPHWPTLVSEHMLIMFVQIVCPEFLFRNVVENLSSELWFPRDLI